MDLRETDILVRSRTAPRPAGPHHPALRDVGHVPTYIQRVRRLRAVRRVPRPQHGRLLRVPSAV